MYGCIGWGYSRQSEAMKGTTPYDTIRYNNICNEDPLQAYLSRVGRNEFKCIQLIIYDYL